MVNELSSEVAVFRFNKEKAEGLIELMENEGDIYDNNIIKVFKENLSFRNNENPLYNFHFV